MPKCIFSFDTEDYVNYHAVDGIIRASKMVREAGFIPCHNVVGWLADSFEKWGRPDAIEEIKKCELSTHSLRHSYHPTFNEYTDIKDFDVAMRLFRENEDQGVNILKRVFDGKEITACCPPGNCCSYVSHYGFADMGFPIYTGGFTIDKVRNRPVSFCNIMVLNYDCYIDDFGDIEKEDILKMVEQFADNDVWVIAHHPAKNSVVEFADDLNFNKTNIDGDWILSQKRSPEWIEKFFENLQFFLDALNRDSRFEPANYYDITRLNTSTRIIKTSDIPTIKQALDEDFFPMTTPMSLSLCDILLACRDFLLGEKVHHCNKVYGFLDTPFAVSEPVKVTRDELKASAEQIKDNQFLPTELTVGNKVIGPADWLRAALAILSGEKEFTIVPGEWQIDLNEFPMLQRQRMSGYWLSADSFEDKYLSPRARLQSWTIRLPENSKRRIF